MMAQVKGRNMELPVVQDAAMEQLCAVQVQLCAVQEQLCAVQAQPSHLLGVLNCETSSRQ